MKSKQSTELMDSSPAVEKPRRYSRTEEEAAEMVRNENKQVFLFYLIKKNVIFV